jgi:heme-degrading monooxygenase HmoA
MIMQIVRFQTELSMDEIQAIAQARAVDFREVPGLVQKYYIHSNETGEYGGVYIWESIESLSAFRDSELAASIPQAYKLTGAPKIEILEVAHSLRS